eukprot:TRINITY_DN7042_c0_g1_i3.p1 TRINITY_DN7042_c0_g1~~TRINITY_DN7042_c0_g1_i3.p1  ORF type:complete len:176 (-),score=19.10 TRINITY_DN7042_c0_g1_i3:465-992(-)
MLLNSPEIFTILLVWPPQLSQDHLHDLLSSVDLQLNINNAFFVGAEQCRYKLKGMICYRDLHYVAFFYLDALDLWIYFNDSKIEKIDDWNAVCKKCISSKSLPCLIFYELCPPLLILNDDVYKEKKFKRTIFLSSDDFRTSFSRIFEAFQVYWQLVVNRNHEPDAFSSNVISRKT